MVDEIVDIMTNRFNKDTLALQLPKAFEQLKGKDAEIEIILSNNLQTTNLLYDHNLITDSTCFWK